MFYSKPGQNSEAVAAQEYINKQLKKQTGKQDASTLKRIGKDSALIEVFEGIPLEQQDFSHVNIAGDITNNPDFIRGRDFGFALSKNYTQEQYDEYKDATATKKHR